VQNEERGAWRLKLPIRPEGAQLQLLHFAAASSARHAPWNLVVCTRNTTQLMAFRYSTSHLLVTPVFAAGVAAKNPLIAAVLDGTKRSLCNCWLHIRMQLRALCAARALQY
jgi:hypothetical protein